MDPCAVLSDEDIDRLSDHDLLASAAADQLWANRLEASRQAKLMAFYRRRAGDVEARRSGQPHFTMTPLRETAVEAAPLLGMSEGKVKADLRESLVLARSFPEVWEMVRAGRLDLYRAAKISEAAAKHLPDAESVAKFGGEMTRWLHRRLQAEAAAAGEGRGAGAGLVLGVTVRQLGNRVSYLVKKLRPADADERFRRRFADRCTRVGSTGDGMGQLYLTSDVVTLQAVDYRMTLLAKALRKKGDARTLEQLRTDLTVDLLLGRLAVDATTGELEHPETSSTGDPLDSVTTHELGRWARPVICVTVPVQTLMGVTDDPGVLSGGESIPAGLVRKIAADPESTWYRLLTDPARKAAELSVGAYRPSAPIVRQVVADHATCFAPSCQVPATSCELDHRVPAPEGATRTGNLAPACKGHHQAKHAPGFGLTRQACGDGRGGLVFTTGAGFAHPVETADQPVGDSWGDPGLWGHDDVTVTELREALSWIGHQRTRAEESTAWLRQVEQAWADYRASYPEATDEEIHGWVHDDDPAAPEPPPVLRRGTTLRELLDDEDAAAPRIPRGVDEETLQDLDDLPTLARLA